jgi:hypothetical protein
MFDTNVLSMGLHEFSMRLSTKHGTWIFGVFIEPLLKVTKTDEEIVELVFVIG